MAINNYFKALLFVVPVFFLSTSILKAAEPETLLGVSFDYGKKEITLQVVSSGCTEKSDFKFVVKNDTLTVMRIKPDHCKAMETMVSFTYSFQEAGINANTKLIVANPFIANPYLARIPGKVKK